MARTWTKRGCFILALCSVLFGCGGGGGASYEPAMKAIAEEFRVAVENRDDAAVERLVGGDRMLYYRGNNQRGRVLWDRMVLYDSMSLAKAVEDPYRIHVGPGNSVRTVSLIAPGVQYPHIAQVVTFTDSQGELHLTSIDSQFLTFGPRLMGEIERAAAQQVLRKCISELTEEEFGQCLGDRLHCRESLGPCLGME